MGNKIGWIISGVLVAIVAIVLGMRVLGNPDHEQPTVATTAPGVLDRYEVGRPVTDIIDSKPTGVGNAADDYMAAAKLYNESIRKILQDITPESQADQTARKIARISEVAGRGARIGPAGADALKAVCQLAANGAAKAEMKFINHVKGAEMDGHNPTSNIQPVQQLNDVANACLALAGYNMAKGQYDEAHTILQGAFTVGWHMAEERARAEVFRAGIQRQFDALRLMELNHQLAGKEDKLDAIRSYGIALQEVNGKISRKWQLIHSHDPHPGDMINIIENDQDRVWKIESLLILGPLKFLEEGHEGNLAKINSLLDEYSNSGDPLIADAASKAKQFNKEDAKRFGIVFAEED
ncbi:MAG: hypothetical protein ACOCZE_11220 [Planctomycetota bacterium]